ncbi:MAG: hypothetical protein FJX76_09545 [Armatimonadetes bacterium]|nr:hypothetical protein [Armatimonadota bacterium]
MIGTPSFLLESAPVLFALILLVAGLGMRASKQPQGRVLPLIVAAIVMGWLMGVRFFLQWKTHQYLERLDAASVRSILVGDQTIDKPEDVKRIVDALRGARWFSPNHGGYDRAMPFEIVGAVPPPVHFRVAVYRLETGAILLLSRGGGWSDGYVFCRDLPAAMAAAGAPFSSGKWVQFHDHEGWVAWYDPDTITTESPGLRVVWVKLKKDAWEGSMRAYLDCARKVVRYERLPNLPESWATPHHGRTGSVTESLQKTVCK